MDKLIEEYVIERLRQHGEMGDGSLECFGFNIENNYIENVKCYQAVALNPGIVNSKQLDKLRLCVEDYKLLFEGGYIRLFGISEKKENQQEKSRITLRINNKIDVEECRRITYKLLYGENKKFKDFIQLMDFEIRKVLNSEKFSLEQIGFELDKRNNVLERKIYFSLYKFDFITDFCGSFVSKEQYDSFFSMLIRMFGLKESLFKKKCISWINKGFMPFMLGINHNSESTQMKIYYICTDQNREKTSYNNFINSEFIGKKNMTTLEEINELMGKCGLYLKGFAYGIDTISGKTNIKPYYYPVTKR